MTQVPDSARDVARSRLLASGLSVQKADLLLEILKESIYEATVDGAVSAVTIIRDLLNGDWSEFTREQILVGLDTLIDHIKARIQDQETPR